MRHEGMWISEYGIKLSINYLGADGATHRYHVDEVEEANPEHREKLAILLAAFDDDLYDDKSRVLKLDGVGEITGSRVGPEIWIGDAE